MTELAPLPAEPANAPDDSISVVAFETMTSKNPPAYSEASRMGIVCLVPLHLPEHLPPYEAVVSLSEHLSAYPLEARQVLQCGDVCRIRRE